MILKLFRCRVRADRRDAFLTEQRRWEALRSVEGFLVQACGFDRDEASACTVIALWNDRRSYDRFMVREHDRILAGGDQAATYDDASVLLAEPFVPQSAYAGDVVSDLARATEVVWADAGAPSSGASAGGLQASTGTASTILWDAYDPPGRRFATRFFREESGRDATPTRGGAEAVRETVIVLEPHLTVRRA
jgi:hypothetical protein